MIVAGQRIRYIRVSSSVQNTERQFEGLLLDNTFTDKVSGKSRDRPALQGMLLHVREGDEVVVHSLTAWRAAKRPDPLPAGLVCPCLSGSLAQPERGALKSDVWHP